MDTKLQLQIIIIAYPSINYIQLTGKKFKGLKKTQSFLNAQDECHMPDILFNVIEWQIWSLIIWIVCAFTSNALSKPISHLPKQLLIHSHLITDRLVNSLLQILCMYEYVTIMLNSYLFYVIPGSHIYQYIFHIIQCSRHIHLNKGGSRM